MMSNNPLDKHIKEALDKIEQKPPMFSSPPFESFFEEDAIDSLIKSNLQDAPLAEKGDWNDFLDKYADQIHIDHPVDQLVEEKLAASTPGANTSNWAAVESSLNLADRRVRMLGIIKSVELALLLLLISSIGTLPFISNSENDLEKVSARENETGQFIFGPDENTISSEFPSFASVKKDKKQGSLRESPELTEPPATRAKKIRPAITLSISDDLKQVPLKTIEAQKSENRFFSGARDRLKLPGELTASKKASQQSQKGFPAQPKIEEAKPKSFVHIPYPELQLFSLSPGAAIANRRSATPIKDFPNSPENPDKVHSYGLGVGWQINRVKTSKDPIYPLPEQTQLDQNLAIGFEWEEKTGENALGFSAGYQQWGYVAPQFTEIYRGNGIQDLQFIQLKQIQFDLINFGLFARKYISSTSKWEFFIHFGGGFRLALRSNYRVQSGDLSTIDASPDDLTEEEIERLPKSPLLFNKNFQEGLFQGGSINENSFMSIDIGGGILYHLSGEWHLQLTPTFNLSPFTDGLGPNRDRVQSLTFQLQIKRTMR
ncbi:MAG: hypothetical protein GVX96_02500 [Bacteroidetes bacterium]|jgi:hypothetical protein|nr:hypothetical protein [Bacteroidota bacterium]